MKNQINYAVQTCNGNPEVIKLVNGKADEIVKEFTDRNDADILSARMNALQSFIEYATSPSSCFNSNEWECGVTDYGFVVRRKLVNWVTSEEVNEIDTYCECSHNFTWSHHVVSNIKFGFEIQCNF